MAELLYALESLLRAATKGNSRRGSRSARSSLGGIRHKPLLRTIELYEADRLDFADAYVCASAETSGIDKAASFDRRIDRVKSIERLEP